MTHYANFPDRTVEVFECDSLPTVGELKKALGNDVLENRLKDCISTLQDAANNNSRIYGPSGYRQTGGSTEDIKH
jgi:hypothetical protein